MGIVLAIVAPAATAVLVALSFVNTSVNAVIAVDKLIFCIARLPNHILKEIQILPLVAGRAFYIPSLLIRFGIGLMHTKLTEGRVADLPFILMG